MNIFKCHLPNIFKSMISPEVLERFGVLSLNVKYFKCFFATFGLEQNVLDSNVFGPKSRAKKIQLTFFDFKRLCLS